MGWNAQDIEKLRNGQNKRTAAHTAATAQTAAPRSAAQTASNARGWTADDIAALRSGTGTKKTTEAWENRSAGAGTRLSGTGSLSGQVLAQMMGSTGSTNPKLQLAVPQTKQSAQAYLGKNGIVTGQSAAQTTPLRGGTAQPEWLTKAQPENRTAEKASTPAARVTGTVKPTEQQRIAGIARGEEGRYAQTAQKVKQYTEDLKATDDFSDFDRLNQWMDADPRHRKLVSLMRAGMGGQSYAERNNAMQPRSVSGAAASTAVPEKSAGGRGYTDAELLEKGYSRKEISEARQYIEDFDALPGWQRAARRTANTIRGIGDTVASSVFLAGETGVQSVKNAAATSGNWKQLQQSVQDDDRQRTLLNLMTGGKTRYVEQDHSMPLAGSSQSGSNSNAYTDAELMAKGYTRQEIDNMRARIVGTEVKDSVDPEKSLGYQLYKRGQDLTAAAQAGLSPLEKQALGIVSSAGENLAVAGINPALVLPVLSAQGGAEAMGQSIEKGESAGKTLAGGLAKFGAGWAINSVGAADLARTMGSDYAKDTLAGKLADVVRSVAADGRLAQQYPAIANTISGGVDNAMQAFVETYADKAIDAALGDSDAAESMFTAETFLNAVESGLTGGASGALGGAVGTGLGKMSAALNAAAGGHTAAAEDAAQKAVRDELRAQEPESKLLQPPAGSSSLKEEAMGTEREVAGNNKTGLSDNEKAGADNAVGVQNTTPIVRSENPAVQQLASAVADGSLTGKTINLFTPNAENEAKRAAFAEEYGVQLPATAAKTGQVLREMTAQQQPTQSMTTASEDAAIAEQEPVAKEDTQTAFTEREALNKAQTDAGDGTVQQVQTESPAVEQTVVENTGESVESRKAEQPGGMRETYGLTQQSLNAKQREVQQELTRWKVSDGASETISRNMPAEIGDAERYAAAASSLYRLGQMEDVTTFDKAMELAQGMRGLAVNTDYVLAQDGGRQALNLAWLQGHGELEAGKAQLGSLGGSLTKESISGSGRVLYKGTMRTANEVGTQLIELNAKATSTDAVMKAVLQGNDRVKAYVDTETGRIFFSDRAEDVFGTILHEDYHWYNSLDAEGAQALQQHALEYLAKSEGFEGIDEMIRGKLTDYAQQGLSYEEAAEELVADAWRGIFSDEASFKRWVEFQRGQAEKNAGKAGTIRKVMTKVKEMLTDIISRAKEVLAKDPENKAALKAQRLAEAEKRVLQDEYFAHAEKAMDNLRAAKENAAALENKGAAKEKRYEINPEYADDVDQWDKDGRNSNRTFILGRTGDALQSLGARENDIYMKADKINTILKEHPEMTLEEIKRIPEILDDPVMILTSQNKGRTKQNTRLVMFGDVKAQDGRPVLCVLDLRPVENHIVISDMQKVTSAYTKDVNPVEFVRKSDVLYVDEKKERTTELFRTLGFKIPSELQLSGSIGRITYGNQDVKLSGVKFTELVNIAKTKIEPSGGTHVESEDSRSRLPDGSKESIAQEAAENKGNDGTLKKNIRLQLAAPVEVDTQKDLVAVHNLTEQNLQEALELGGMPSPSIAVVKAQEGHTKYGPISLVFGSETIDPMANSANRIYGSDAWTPTRPNVEYEVKADKARELNTYLAQLSRQTAEGEFARGNMLSGTLDMEASDKSPQQLAEQLAHNDAAKAAYLADRGENVDVVMKQEQRFTESQISRYEKVMEAVGGKENLREIIETDRANGSHDMANAVLEEVRSAEKNWAMQELGWDEEKAEKKAAKLIAPMLRVRLENAYEYATTEDTGGKMVQDTDAMRQILQEKAPDADVEKWLLPKIEKILGKKGIYNGKEVFTRNGNRRSFAQLHNPYTLENIVNAMNQEDARGKGAWGLSANTLMSTATAEYETLDDVRADKDRLQQIPEEEYKTLLEKADGQIEDVVARLRRETTPHTSSSYEEREIIGDVLLRAAQGKRTSTAIEKAFAKEGYSISKDTAQVILNLYNDVAQIPTGYFEAKPQRAVDFDEVRAAILPDNTSKSLIAQLKDAGVPVELYKAGDDAERTKLMNEVPNVRFQLAEQADRDAKRNDQQTASRTIADKAAALDTLSQFFGLTRGVKVSRTAIEGLASRWAKANGSKVDRAKLARETEVLVEYLKADGADMNKAEALAETLAGEVLDGATYRNSELWDEYPELHKLEYTVNKTGQAKAELVKAYGSWSEAVAEARKHGVCLRQADGVRDGNPAEQYESVINDYRAVGGISDGAKALWKAAAQQAGVDGAGSMESTEWLSVLMNLHDAIKPVTMSRFSDDAEYEDAKVELAGRMIGDILNTPEMTDAQAIFEGIQQHSLQMAKAAAGSEERAAEVEKGLKGVQKVQQREFGRRLAKNRRAEVQQMTELQRQNAKAEKLLDENLETLGVDITNMGDLNEKLTFLRESYEREMKQEVKRMKAERQEMLDEAKLEMQKLRSEKNELAWQLKQEQRRADKAEYSLIVQENEIMEWEADNERKRAAFEQKQAQRNAIAIETARQQRDEDIAAAKAVAEKRVQRAWDARKMDELKRGIRQNAAQLNQMLLRPSKDKHVPQSLISAAADVAKMADAVILNDRAVNRLTALQDSITAQMGKEGSPTAMTEEWKQTKVPELIQTLRDDLTAAKRERLAHLEQQLAEAKELPDSEKARALQERIQKRIRETENRTYLPMTVDQMRMLKAITSSTLHVIRNANKTVSLAKAEEVDKIAGAAAEEVRQSKGNHPGGVLDGVHNFMTKYQLDMLGGERVFRMLGGYAKDGQMEKMAKMLNDGQYQQTKITIEGEKMFAEVTGKEHVKEMEKFSGSGADTVDIGLRDTKNNEVPLTHAQLCSLYMHLHNKDSIEHLMTGGFVIPNAKYYSKGDIEQAYQKGQAVHLGMLKNADGTPTADSILQTVEAAMTDYDRAWCRIMKEFFGSYTAKLINETSLQLVGYQRATEKNYYPIAVDKSALATQIEGLNLDATIEGRGFLKNRVKSSQPILLEECSNVVQRSLRDTAAYAGLAAPIRDVQKILNSGVETEDGLTNLKNGLIKQQWGKDVVSYIDDLLTDLQTTQRKRPSTFNKVLGNLRGNYAGAVLTLNPGVAIAQAASLPTAAAVLGGDTMAAVVPFVKNASPKQRAALEAEIKEHGDVLLDWRKRGSQNGELASIGKQKTLAEKGMDKLPNWLTGWINGMDEVTVAALWEGSKRYVQNHTAEFEGAEVTGSPAYWEAVNRTYQKVIEQTQPNYTVMQRAGIQRNPNELLKQLTMFTTQRFQNYGILADAVGDYKAQVERYQQNQSAENKAEKQRAGKQLRRAAVSQVAQTAVFAVMKIGADFLLHRWDREQDENGDVTVKSMWNRFRSLFTESFAGNFLYGSEIYSLIDNAMNGKDYDVLSAASISVVNDLAGDAQKFFAEFRKDTSDMDEEKLQQHHEKLIKRFMNLLEDSFEVAGVPYGNGRKIVEAVQGYVNDIENITHGGKFSFNSVPQSATGQYDRLYNAYRNKDVDEAWAATEKLAEMGKDGEIYKQLKTRLKKYDPNIQKAAEAQVNGDEVQRYQLETQTIEQIYEVMGIRRNVKEDAPKREAVIDCVTGAVNAMADEQLKGDGGSVTDDLVEALDSGRAQDVQQELNRLMTAGKDAKNLKSKITEVCKPEYLAGSDTDKQQMEEMLLGLTDAEGNALYTEKTFDTWTRNAEKAAEKEDVTADPYAALK